jgi:FAD/FMN-containing dehydrogenase
MGLTGLVTRLALRLMPVSGPFMRQDVLPFDTLDAFFEIAAASDASHAYTVAWLDSLAAGAHLGRGVFFRANHAQQTRDDAGKPGAWTPSKPLPFLPFTPPIPLVNGLSMRLFNALYRAANREKRDLTTPLEPFFWPLDRVGGWNRAYGRKGLRQFQCVVPLAQAREAVSDLLRAAHKAGEASFLTVLKLFGDLPSPGLLSFPMPGATLTLDVAYRGARTDALLAELDRITLEAGGRVNPYKDARMSAAVFEASFPAWREFARHVDPEFTSNFWRRVTG